MGAPLYPLDAPLILIVEDDEDHRELFSHTLSLAGFRVWPHERAADALAAINAMRPDLIVAELVLPGMDGAEFCRRLRTDPATADIPIVLVTGWSITQSTVQHLPHGEGLSVLIKPFVPERLVRRVKRQLSRRAIARSGQTRARAAAAAQRTRELPAVTGALRARAPT